MNENVADLPQRIQALSPGESFIVQAPAGSGKTELLIQRYLRLLGIVEHPEEIIAITFTRKAAAEMQDRVLRALDQARGDVAPSEEYARRTHELARAALRRDEERGWSLHDNPARLRIHTIDSLCAQLTRRMPLLSGLGSQPEIIEDVKPLYRRAVEATLAELEGVEGWTGSAAVLLAHLDNDLPRVRDLVASMLARRDQWLVHVVELDREHLEAALRRLVESTLDTLRQSFPAALRPELVVLLRQAADHLARAGRESYISACTGVRDLPDCEAEDLPKWQGVVEFLLTAGGAWRKEANANIGFAPVGGKDGDAEARRAAKSRFKALLASLSEMEGLRRQLLEVQHLPPVQYTDQEWAVVEALCSLLKVADAQLSVLFAEENCIDFTGITRAAIAALGQDEAPTDLALHLDYRVRHILVDEFQDISAQQYRLLGRLTAEWMRGDGRTLFLVGDPMQSIYRFREAEVGLFLDTWKERRLGPVELTPLRVTVNFRSRREIVEWVNRIFARVLPPVPDVARGAVAYAPAEPFHATGEGKGVYLRALAADDGSLEAERVEEIVSDARRRDPGASVAILVRNRSVLSAIVPRLKNAGLSFRAVEIEALGHRPAIQDLMALTRALCHPADRIAWLALLRAPWCGLTLEDLLHIAAEGDGTIIEQLEDPNVLARLSERGRIAAGFVQEQMKAAAFEQGRRRLARWVESTWLRLGGPATLADPADLDNVRTYFDLLDNLERGSELGDLERLQERSEALYAAPDPDADPGLQIMTIHKAKGLEFDIVIVPGLGRGSGRQEPSLLRWAQRSGGGGVQDLLLAPIPEAGKESAIYTCLKYFEAQKQEFEEGRLIYVAATRARSELHLIGSVGVRENGEVSAPRRGTLMAQLWPAAAAEFEDALEEGVRADETGSDTGESPLLCRHAADWRLPEPAVPPVRVPIPIVLPPEPGPEVEFQWAGETIQHVGTVVHRCIQELAESEAGRSAERIAAHRSRYRQMLRGLGVPPEELDEAAADVERSLRNLVEDPRGKWLLESGHVEARNEYALTGLHGGELVRVVMDRTFVDPSGTRWIVDYKTGRHEGRDLDAFLDREQQRYRPQLERYAVLMRKIDERPVKLGLYFPLLRGWREWSYAG